MVDIFREVTGPLYPVLDWPFNTGPNGGYQACSGLFGLGVLGTFWHRHNCHEDGCWRIVRHGRLHCRKHAPKAPAL